MIGWLILFVGLVLMECAAFYIWGWPGVVLTMGWWMVVNGISINEEMRPKEKSIAAPTEHRR